jgi:hypothetical protein
MKYISLFVLACGIYGKSYSRSVTNHVKESRICVDVYPIYRCNTIVASKSEKGVYCGVAQANFQISQAFAIEAAGDSWCLSVQSTGAGLTDCFSFFTMQRQFTVANIIANFQECVSEVQPG